MSARRAAAGPPARAWRLGVLLTHPVQYLSPWFRFLASRLELRVFYAHRQDAAGQARAGHGVGFEWDVPLLEGYAHEWLQNVARRPGPDRFGGCDTPGVAERVRSGGFDAFLVFGWNHRCSLQALRACRRAGVPVLMRGDSQLATPRPRLRRALKRLPYRLLLPRLDAHLYVGSRNREYLRHYGVPERRLFFAPHFVDAARFAAAARAARADGSAARLRRDHGVPAGAFVLLFVGRLVAWKRVGDLLRAAARLPDGGAGPVHVMIAGDGPCRAGLGALAETALGERAHFLGFRNQTRLPACYAAADALVLPSGAEETWGLVVNEAAACGVPAVVSSAAGCAPDMIEAGATGFTYPAGAVGALAARLRDLRACCREDPRAVSAALARKSRQYSMEAAWQGLQRALHATAGQPAHAPLQHEAIEP